jgi:DNA primase large subunit
MSEVLQTKKAMILRAAAAIGAEKWTPAEIEQLRRKLLADHGAEGKTGSDYIAEVLQSAGWKVTLTQQEEAEDQFEEEFEVLLHFKTLSDAEVSLMRLDELLRRFRTHEEKAAAERVLQIARLGKRRAEMIARNHKVEAHKREEKEEIANWFRVWLENPDAFFDWVEVRKQSPEFRTKFPEAENEE